MPEPPVSAVAPLSLRQRLLVGTGLLLAVFFLWLSLREVQFAQVVAALGGARLEFVPLFVALIGAFYVLKAFRWSLLLSPLRALVGWRLLPAIMIGYSASAILPLQLGELVRAHITARQERLPGAAVLATVGLERVFDLLTLLLVLAVGLGVGGNVSANLVTAGLYLGAIAAVALMLAAGCALATERFVAAASVLTRVLPEALGQAIVHHTRRFGEGLHAARRPGLILRIVANSAMQWSCMCACIYVSLVAVGIDASLPVAVVVLLFTVLSLTLPTSPGNVGSIQAAYYLALKPFGVSASAALSASLFFHVLSYAVVLPLGIYWLRSAGCGLGTLRQIAAVVPRENK